MTLINLSPADLDTFISVADTCSFRQSAVILGISQPAVSARIKHLEAVLGVRLFHRTTRRVVITDAGERLRSRVERMVLDTRSLIREFRDEAHLQRGRVVVGASPSVAAGFLPKVISEFQHRWPDIEVVLMDDFFGRALDRVSRGEVDIAVGPFEAADEAFAFEPLLRDYYRLAVSDSHPLATRPDVSLSEIAREKLLSMPPESASYATTRRAFAANGLNFNPAFQTRDSQTLFSLVKQGVGIGLVTEMSTSVLDRQGVTMIPVRDVDLTRLIGIVQVQGRTLTPAAEAFCKLLRSTALKHKLRV
ncbi:MAG: LysR family transcriptional regulator [Rhodospirillales bacterium]